MPLPVVFCICESSRSEKEKDGGRQTGGGGEERERERERERETCDSSSSWKPPVSLRPSSKPTAPGAMDSESQREPSVLQTPRCSKTKSAPSIRLKSSASTPSPIISNSPGAMLSSRCGSSGEQQDSEKDSRKRRESPQGRQKPAAASQHSFEALR